MTKNAKVQFEADPRELQWLIDEIDVMGSKDDCWKTIWGHFKESIDRWFRDE
jgi:hypothetical protein